MYYQWLKKHCKGKKVLDYGCGNGRDVFLIKKWGAKEVIGIDLKPPKGKEFIKMDCEDLEFSDNLFDIVFCNGSLPYVDKKIAFIEISRVLKPNGYFIAFETLGDNPIFNLYRRLRPKSKERLSWGKEEVIKTGDIEIMKKYFQEVKTKPLHFSFKIIIIARK